jgi:hypothetical protein
MTSAETETFIRCKKCRTTLIPPRNEQSVLTCHGTSTPPMGSQCYLDKSAVYVAEDQMPPWLEKIVQEVAYIYY